MWLVVDVKTDTKKPMFERDWITCSKYFDHSRLNNQHDHSVNTIVFTLTMKKMFI